MKRIITIIASLSSLLVVSCNQINESDFTSNESPTQGTVQTSSIGTSSTIEPPITGSSSSSLVPTSDTISLSLSFKLDSYIKSVDILDENGVFSIATIVDETPFRHDFVVTDNTKQANISFRVNCKTDYIVKEIDAFGNYDELLTPDSTNIESVYQLTSVKEDVKLKVSSSSFQNAQLIKNVSSSTNTSGFVTFSILFRTFVDITKTRIEVYKNGGLADTIEIENNSFSYQLISNYSYIFKFIPYVGSVPCVPYSVHRAFVPQLNEIHFLKMDIITKNSEWPRCDLISTSQIPEGTTGHGIKNCDYVESRIVIRNESNEVSYDSGEDYSGAKIKVRGNSSAWVEKKPYKIKLNKKDDLLKGLVARKSSYKTKDWVLLSSGHSLQNAISRNISNLIQNNYDLQYRYLSLTLNGDFRGLYILSDSINKSSCHVDDTGFICEEDLHYWKEKVFFNTSLTENDSSLAFSFKQPDPDDITSESEEFIATKNIMCNVSDAIKSNEDNLNEIIDFQSFANWLLIHDILLTYDANGSNPYYILTSNIDTVVGMGPTWDFDSTLGMVNDDINYSDAQNIQRFSKIRDKKTHPFYYLVCSDEFMSIYKNTFITLLQDIQETIAETMLCFEQNYSDLLNIEISAFQRNTWSVLSTQTSKFDSFLSNHLEWMNEHI